ncbi:MAG: Peptidase, partial [Thermoleophilia bacterium]|nr:Peptidase [Thermoleophilia bacterium]
YSFGTSIAAPIVSGALADLMSFAPTATHEQLLAALASTAHDIGKPGPDDDSGYGLIDIGAAVSAVGDAV